MKNDELFEQDTYEFKERDIGQIIFGLGVFVIFTLLLGYLIIFERENVNLVNLLLAYLTCHVLSLYTLLSLKIRVLTLDCKRQYLVISKRFIFRKSFLKYNAIPFMHISHLRIRQKCLKSSYSFKNRYKLQIYLKNETKAFCSFFHTTNPFKVKEKYFLLNLLMKKEFNPDESKIPIDFEFAYAHKQD